MKICYLDESLSLSYPIYLILYIKHFLLLITKFFRLLFILKFKIFSTK